MPNFPLKIKILLILAKNAEKQKLKIYRISLFHRKTRVCLKYCRMIVKDCRSSPDPENSRCGHQQPYILFFSFCRFLDFSRQLRKTKICRFEAEKVAATWEKYFSQLSQKERFLELFEKILISL